MQLNISQLTSVSKYVSSSVSKSVSSSISNSISKSVSKQVSNFVSNSVSTLYLPLYLYLTSGPQINEPNNVFILDEDLNEVHTHAEESGTDDLFDVEPTTGNIISVQYLQLVPVSDSISTAGPCK